MGVKRAKPLEALRTQHFTVQRRGQNSTLRVNFLLYVHVTHTKSNNFFKNGDVKIQLNAQNNAIYTLVYIKENGEYSCVHKLTV